MTKQLTIIGAGSYCEVMIELAQACGYDAVGIYDDDESKRGNEIFGVPVVGTTRELFESDLNGLEIAVAIGNGLARRNIMKKIRSLGGQTPTLIHPSVEPSPSAQVGQGVYIQPGAFIWTKVRIEDDCIISPNVVIAHHSKVGPGCLVSTLTAIGSHISIEENTFVGMGATVMTGVKTVGSNSIIGAGSVVIKDVEPNSVVAGSPARLIRKNVTE